MSRVIRVQKENIGKRLDIFLVKQFTEKSRSFWQKQIKAGAVLVNGEKAKVHEWLKEGDQISIKIKQENNKTRKQKKLKYKLLHEDEDYLIVEKPAGLLTHSVDGELGLADQIAMHYPEIEGVGEKYRWGIVHRLDKGVSGILVVAKTDRFFQHIKRQFKKRKVKKIYLALVYGKIEKDEDDISFVIARTKEGRMAARPHSSLKLRRAGREDEGKEAITHFEVLERFKNYTYLEVQILTGRTHQIRTHMLAYGHPIVGDVLYRVRKQKIKEPCELDRIFLHSHMIGFEGLDGKRVEYESRLPKILRYCLKDLK